MINDKIKENEEINIKNQENNTDLKLQRIKGKNLSI